MVVGVYRGHVMVFKCVFLRVCIHVCVVELVGVYAIFT